jgi:hypothetical protein
MAGTSESTALFFISSTAFASSRDPLYFSRLYKKHFGIPPSKTLKKEGIDLNREKDYNRK